MAWRRKAVCRWDAGVQGLEWGDDPEAGGALNPATGALAGDSQTQRRRPRVVSACGTVAPRAGPGPRQQRPVPKGEAVCASGPVATGGGPASQSAPRDPLRLPGPHLVVGGGVASHGGFGRRTRAQSPATAGPELRAETRPVQAPPEQSWAQAGPVGGASSPLRQPWWPPLGAPVTRPSTAALGSLGPGWAGCLSFTVQGV